jgi:1-acyl-sn-glycerol-3-phosphate acyltransferase
VEPGERAIGLLGRIIAPWSYLTAPVFVGLDRIPADRPVLYVGNHTLMGGLDVPLMMAGFYEARGIVIHSLGDRIHFGIPGWRSLVEAFGVIEGSPENCRQAMREGRSLVVFPGGAREVMKRKSEKYKLVWGDRSGFARLALETGYTIVPFASVGADDCYDVLVDGDDLLESPIGGLIRRFHPRPDFLPPLVRGVGPSLLPRPERFYFHFGEPISSDPQRYGGDHTSPEACARLRDVVRAAVEEGLSVLLEQRRDDPQRRLRDRLLGAKPEGAPGANARDSAGSGSETA